ncbi:class I SAM-dependent methyltransferase [Microbispora triticiradicis]|uniref:class I SAM-dependent methyltransferase n=1 Tax=Microbispora triticiradicis TaxID=2200763 RepID=UPI001AD77165|nr:50S ribosomal protein L11 methyltransferase [Microbispora triticiradicis]MBO4273943.1 methyltransferase [Microbispora triticiradicis]
MGHDLHAEAFVRAHTRPAPVPYVPEVRLRVAGAGEERDETNGELYEIWERAGGLPFWAYPWAGGQALARHVLDHPETVRGRTVLDLATGSGLVAVAAALAGAALVVANDVDPYALAAVRLNAAANGVAVRVLGGDLLDGAPPQEVVLAGDVFYESPLALRVTPFLARAAGKVLTGVPDRACSYLPEGVFEPVGVHEVPTLLEDAPRKRTTIYRLSGQ